MANGRSLPPQEDDFARALLRSADADEPPSAAYAKVATSLGVSAAVGMSASVPAAAAASGLARWFGSLAAKLALLGVSGALLVGAAGAFFRHRVSAGTALSHIAPAHPAPVVVPRAPLAQSTVVTVAGAASGARAIAAVGGAQQLTATPVAALAPPARVSARAPRPMLAAAHTSSLPEQVQSLDRARVALGAGDSSAALVEIAHYRQAWPNGVFLTEASVLEIEALAKRGETTLAAARAKAFVEAHPDSPQAEHLRALIPADRH